MPIWKLWLVVSFVAFATGVGASDLDAPWLQLDPGAHWAPVRRVAVSPDQRFVATASDDKTVRVWQADTKTLVQVLRPPIGQGRQGRLYGVAYHPSRSLLAVGGTSATGVLASIYLFDPQTGELARSIDAGAGEIKRLVWSPDGRWLLAGFAAPGGLKVFAVDAGETSSDKYRGDCYGVDVSPTHQVVATDTSGRIHFYQWDPLESTCRHASLSIL